MNTLHKSKDNVYRSLDDVEAKLSKFDWISSHEIFFQQIERITGSKDNDSDILINKIMRTGIAIRLITRNRRFMEGSFGIPTLSRIDELKQPKSTVKIIDKDTKFPKLQKPHRMAILGDQSRSLTEPEDLIRDKLDGIEGGYDSNSKLIQNKYTIELEQKGITNTGSLILFNSSSRIQFNVLISALRNDLFMSLSRKQFSRNSDFSLDEVVQKAKIDIEKRFTKIVNFDRQTVPIILHPEVLGKIIAFHSSYYLLNKLNESRSEMRFWKENLSLFDDPLRDNGFGSEIFDDEGTITKPKKIIEDGFSKETLQSLSGSSWKKGGNAYRAAWYQPLLRSYDYPLQRSFSNLIVVGGMGKGVNFTQRSGEVVVIKQGTGYVGGTLREPYFVVHTSEAELWKNGEFIGPVKNFTINGSIDNILKHGDLSADLTPVIDQAIPGAIYVGWLYLEPQIL